MTLPSDAPVPNHWQAKADKLLAALPAPTRQSEPSHLKTRLELMFILLFVAVGTSLGMWWRMTRSASNTPVQRLPSTQVRHETADQPRSILEPWPSPRPIDSAGVTIDRYYGTFINQAVPVALVKDEQLVVELNNKLVGFRLIAGQKYYLWQNNRVIPVSLSTAQRYLGQPGAKVKLMADTRDWVQTMIIYL